MSLVTTLKVGSDTVAYIEAKRTHDGCDGTHTYHWEWGIEHNGYQKMDEGELQHRESDGAITLLALIIEKIRGRKASK
jgi:hypothetical protein